MKKLVFTAAMLFLLFLTACANQAAMAVDEKERANYLQSEGITVLDEGVWPENAYTEGLPVPPGTVAWAVIDTQRSNCGIGITDMTEHDYSGYIERLRQAGFSVMEHAAEAVKGQGYVSIGTLLSDGEKALSISFLPGSFTMYIALEA